MTLATNHHAAEMPALKRALAGGQPATAVAALLFATLIISFRPFTPVGPELSGGGDVVNQLGFGIVAAIAIGSLVTLADPRKLLVFLSPWWLLLLGCLCLSVLNTPIPSATMRSVAFSLIGIITVVAILALPRDADAFSRVLAFAGFAVLGLSYFGLVAMPSVAIHQAGELEYQHAGLWRGLFTHKNIAGPVMANFAFAGIYLWRRGWRGSGGLMFLLAMVFVFNTGSKTAAATVAMATLLVALPGTFGARMLVPVLIFSSICIMAVATLGIVFIEPVKHLAAFYFPDLTYTGRTSLWQFSGEMIAKRPWTGYGFENFWQTATVANTDQPFDRDWDVRGAVHSHDGYLDVAIAMGIPALCLSIVTFVLVPLRDYMRVPLFRENVLMADMFMMITVFTLFNAFLESFFFRRTDPVWMFFAFAVLGLRLASRWRVSTSA